MGPHHPQKLTFRHGNLLHFQQKVPKNSIKLGSNIQMYPNFNRLGNYTSPELLMSRKPLNGHHDISLKFRKMISQNNDQCTQLKYALFC